MTNDEILIVQYPFRMTKDRQMILHRNILEQKATGVILLPDYCKVITKPKDIDIQVELEEGHTCGECKWFSADYFHREFECTNKIVPNGDDVCSSKWPACKLFELGGTCEAEDVNEKDEEIWCTECPYFKYVADDDDSWYGAKCHKDGHEANPSMYAVQSLHDDCPLKKESEERGE